MNWDAALSQGALYWILVVIALLLMYIAFGKKGHEKSSKKN